MQYFVADFETSTEKWLKYDTMARVWCWDICDCKDYSHPAQGIDIASFFDFIFKPYKKAITKTVFFHNLRYDGSYIIDYALRSGFTWTTDKELKPMQFSTLISGEGQFYQIKMKKQYKNQSITVTIQDSLKKFTSSVAEIARAFKLPILKECIDYDEYRAIGYEPSADEWQYVKHDTEIVARAMRSKLDIGLTRMTKAADALSNYQEIIGGKNVFRDIYPELDEVVDTNIRKAYKGGYVYLCKDFENKIIDNVTSYDVNSLFPSVMRFKELPYGAPLEFEGKYKNDKNYPLYIQFLSCNFDIKPGQLPTIQLKNSMRFLETEYIEHSGEDAVFLALTSVDLTLFFERYNVTNIEYVGGYKFKSSKYLFVKYIDFWIEQKIANNDNPALRQAAKDMLNSLYGKFAKRVENSGKQPYIEDNIVKYTIFEDEPSPPIYTALSCFVTAYAREQTQRVAQRFHDEGRYIYSDTDSVHVIGPQPEWLDVDNTRLGAWKNEGTANKAKFLRAKTYIKLYGDKYKVTCAGMPDNIKSLCNFKTFYPGAVFGEKFVQKTVPGGCILHVSPFTIKLKTTKKWL